MGSNQGVTVSSEAQHARLAPSSASRRRACPGSLVMSERYPETESTEASREGTAAHEVMADYITMGGIVPLDEREEMQRGAELIGNNVFDVMRANPNGQLRVEQKVAIDTIHLDCWGTPDVSYVTGSELYIWDYKFGHGFVEVYENWQMIEYAAGLLELYAVNGLADQHLWVYFRIVQPRCYHPEGQIREWKIRASDLRNYFNQARHFEALATQPLAALQVSEECDYCPARHACTALQHASLKACDRSYESNPFDLPAEALGYEMATLARAADLLKARLTGLEAQVEAKLRAGEYVPYWALGRGQGKTQWKVPNEQVVSFGDLMGVDLRKPVDVITPKQAVTKKLDPALVDQFSEFIPGAVQVVREDKSLAARVFDGGVNK